MSPSYHTRAFRPAAVKFALAAMLALTARSAAAQSSPASGPLGPTSPESVLGVPMGTDRRALHDYLAARGWVQVADSIEGIGAPSLHTGTLAGRSAEVIAMFGASSGRLVNLAINVPATSGEELRAAYADLYRLLERKRCKATVPADYASQLDSILRGSVPHIPRAESVPAFKPLLAGHTTLAAAENTDWPSPIWANSEAEVGTQLSASLLDKESRWPYQVTLWSGVSMMVARVTMCADSRAALDSADRADRAEFLARRRARRSGAAPSADSVVVMAGPGVTIRADTLVVRGTEKEPGGVVAILHRPRGSTIRYDVRVAPEFEALKVFASDTVAAAHGAIVLDTTSIILAVAQPRPRAETKRLYELLRAELTSNNPLAAVAAAECETERLYKQYPATASRWIKEVQARAHDPEKDGKAMRQLDAAMGGHVFGGCAADSKRYPAAP